MWFPQGYDTIRISKPQIIW